MDEVIRAQAEVLLDLKRADEQTHRYQVGLKQIPEELTALQEKQRQLDENFATAKSAFSDTEKKLRASEQELKSKEDELHRAETKLMEVRNNDEYQAALKENEARRVSKGELEEKALLMMDELEEQRARFKTLEKDLAVEKNQLAETKTKLEQQKKQLEIDVVDSAKAQTQFLSRLQPNFSSIYRRISNDGQVLAIAYAQDGSCSSCHMKVRPQLYNEVISHKAIHQCGECRKILIPAPGQAAHTGLEGRA